MVFGDEADLRADEHVVAQGDAAPVHKGAGVVDEYVFSDADICAEVCIKGRPQREVVFDLLPRQLGKQPPYLFFAQDLRIELLRQHFRLVNDRLYLVIFGIVAGDGLARPVAL